MTKPIGAIVLAAGFSSRFGSSKLLARLETGKSVFQQTLERIAEAYPRRIVVTRPEMVAQLAPQAPSATILSFDHAEQGMGATLAYAAKQLGDWQGCVICLADMPFIDTSTYQCIAEQVSPDSITVPTFNSKRGNPVAFGKDFFAELGALTGDSGGKKLMRLHPHSVRELTVPDSGILKDIDTLEELALHQKP